MKKIAVPITRDNQIENHFGHCQSYEVYTFSDTNEVLDLQLIDSEKKCGCKSDIINILAHNEVTFMLSGIIGSKAKNKLNRAGIEVIRGCSGDSSTVVLEFIEGNISDNGIGCLQHTQKHKNANCQTHNN
jgi:predicted Fe-Mo cluster-binding NifX family protein